ncbi:hypothetical protein PR001_g16972 [Phytophthora rubi]|uniref:Uncharacterized protein n=1 Tax=Phytophthora rubi TaxID=129364 RepID=A0A6A3KP11_9STRA|nr:hypothetical protein PR002_g17150 [Phytophthora rubi]KAE9007427.1 hypothetical protein PR001_g16972 [Phytophthora rubi]
MPSGTFLTLLLPWRCGRGGRGCSSERVVLQGPAASLPPPFLAGQLSKARVARDCLG